MAVVKPYPIGEVVARPEATGLGGGSAPLSAFGPALPSNARQVSGEGADLQRAGALLENTSDNLAKIALGEMHDTNEARVQDLNNQFIGQQQKLLYTAPDAFYRKQGADAITGAPDATQQLLDLQKGLIDQTSNEYQKQRLTGILNSHVNEATNGISRHVATQSIEWQKNVTQGKQDLVVNQARLDNGDWEKVDGLAGAAELNAVQMAKTQGLAGTDAEKSLVAKARSQVYGSALDQTVQEGNQRRALALYNKVRDKLDGPTNDCLSTKMISIAADVAADDWIMKASPNALGDTVNQWKPKVYDASVKYGVDPALALAVLKTES